MTAEFIKDFISAVGLTTSYIPKAFDFFHLSWILLTVLGVIIALKIYDKRYIGRYFLVAVIILAVGEVYRQVILSLKSGTFEYPLNRLPLQFATVPIYTYLLSVILKRGKFYDCLCAYNATFGFIAGIISMLFPTPAFSEFMGLNLQAMLHYSIIIIIGAITLRTYAKNLKVRLFCLALVVFVIFASLTETLNAVIPLISGQEANLYFIGRYMQLGMPIFSHVKQAFPHAVFVIFYCLIIIELTIALAYIAHKVANKKKIYH